MTVKTYRVELNHQFSSTISFVSHFCIAKQKRADARKENIFEAKMEEKKWKFTISRATELQTWALEKSLNYAVAIQSRKIQQKKNQSKLRRTGKKILQGKTIYEGFCLCFDSVAKVLCWKRDE